MLTVSLATSRYPAVGMRVGSVFCVALVEKGFEAGGVFCARAGVTVARQQRMAGAQEERAKREDTFFMDLTRWSWMKSADKNSEADAERDADAVPVKGLALIAFGVVLTPLVKCSQTTVAPDQPVQSEA